MSRTKVTAKTISLQHPPTGGKTPRSSFAGKAPRKTPRVEPPDPESESEHENDESETESEDDDGDGEGGGDDADLTTTQREDEPESTPQSEEASNTFATKKGGQEKAQKPIDNFRKHRAAISHEAHQQHLADVPEKSKFLPKGIVRQIRQKSKRIPKAIYDTRAYKVQRAAERHMQNVINANLGDQHVRVVRQNKKAQSNAACRRKNQALVKQIAQQPNQIQLWMPAIRSKKRATGKSEPPIQPAFCAGQCEVIGNGRKGEIEKGSLIVVRYVAGTKGHDGFVPNVPLFYHLECLSTPMLARYANPATFVFHAKLPDAEKAKFRTLVDKAVVSMADAPLPSKKKKIDTNALSVTAFKRLARPSTKAAAKYHRERRTWKQHITYTANKRAESLIMAAQKQCKKTNKRYKKLEVENANIRIINDAIQNATNMYESMLTQRGRKLAFDKKMRVITREESRKLKSDARDNAAAHFDLISNCYRAMEECPALREEYIKALERLSPGLSNSHMAMLETLADRPPGGFATAGDNAGKTVRSYLDSILGVPLNFNDRAENEDNLEFQLDKLAGKVENALATSGEEEEDAGGHEVDQLASD